MMTPHHIFFYPLVEEMDGCKTVITHPVRENCTRRRLSETHALPEYHDESGFYEIRIKGHLNNRWTGWFGDLTITLEDNGDTLLTGPVIDQAELHGLLKKVRDLGMPLLSVNFVNPGQAETQEVKS